MQGRERAVEKIKNSSSTGAMGARPEHYSISFKGSSKGCGHPIARSGDEWLCCPSLGEGTKGSCRLQGERMLPQEIHVETWDTAKIMGPGSVGAVRDH